MKDQSGVLKLMGFAVTSLGGTLLHFLYEWSGESWLVAPFSGVNESTWEHMKLLFWPMLAFAAAESLFFRHDPSYGCIKMRGILIGITLIPILFYTYNGVIGKSPDFVNISIFFVAAAVAYIYEARATSRDIECRHPHAPLFILLAIAALFVIFSFVAPPLEIFRDPTTGELA